MGVEVVPFLAKQIQRRQLPLTRECFICGDMDVTHGAMKQLDVEPPLPNDFPPSLEPYFRRKLWRSSIRSLEQALEQGREVFAKPAGRRKRFTGRVFSSPGDMYYLAGTSAQEPLWCSEVVRWLSEFRIYVIHGEVTAINPYHGDASVSLCEATLREAISAFTASGQAPAAYGIDFGVLDSGETALVEANDGFSLGAYGINAERYTELLFTRWEELVRG